MASLPLIDGFDWDNGNQTKCQKHGLALPDIEAVFRGVLHVLPDPAHSTHETRFLAIGKTSTKRPVLVAFTIRVRGQSTLIRPISARYMHAKEVEHHEAQIAHTKQ